MTFCERRGDEPDLISKKTSDLLSLLTSGRRDPFSMWEYACREISNRSATCSWETPAASRMSLSCSITFMLRNGTFATKKRYRNTLLLSGNNDSVD